jgi:DNA replication protein DnaC
MTNEELERALRQLRLGGMADSFDTFDWKFNSSTDRALVYELATARFIEQRQDCLILGNRGCGKSYLAQGIGRAAIRAGFSVCNREAHRLFEDLVLATATDERANMIAEFTAVPLLIVDDLGMRKLPAAVAEDLLELVMRRYKRTSTIITSNRPLEDWPKLLGDTPAVTALLDRLMHHGHLLEIHGKSYGLHESSSRRGA